MVILAPEDAREDSFARRFFERVLASRVPVRAVHYRDGWRSLQNGGGPACYRLAVPLEEGERDRIKANVFFTEALEEELSAWIERHYRDRLVADDLADPSLARETMMALDALTAILGLGSVYDFQKE